MMAERFPTRVSSLFRFLLEAVGNRVVDAEFQEADHPRDKDGKFGDKGGGGGSSKVTSKPPKIVLELEPSEVMKNPNFRKWFRDSKVVDDKGNPLVVYHGSKYGVPQKFGDDKAVTLGPVFLTDNHEVARHYAEGRSPEVENGEVRWIQNEGEFSGQVGEFFLSIKKPITDETTLEEIFGSEEKAQEFRESDFNYNPQMFSTSMEEGSDLSLIAHAYVQFPKFREFVKGRGFDGWVYWDEESSGTTFIPFSSDQIRGNQNTNTTKISDAEPTPAQIEAGNYKKRHRTIQGLAISIENPKGSTRRGVTKEGAPWETELQHDYGYIKGTVGKDKDHVDVFLGPDLDSEEVFIIDQVDPDTRRFDEHKVVLGCRTSAGAVRVYKANYQQGWDGFGAVTQMDMGKFKRWLESSTQGKSVSGQVMDEFNESDHPRDPDGKFGSGGGGGSSEVTSKPEISSGMKPHEVMNNPNFKKWFGESKIVDDKGNPLVMYHGTKRDVSEFKAKYEDNLIFLTTDPEFASHWPEGSGGKGDLREPPEESKEEFERMHKLEHNLYAKLKEAGVPDDELYDKTKEEMTRLTGYSSPFTYERKAGVRVMPVYVSAQKPFDPRKDYKLVEPLLGKMPRMQGVVEKGLHKAGNWIVYENKEVMEELRRLGYDGIWIAENIDGPHDTLGIFDPSKIKSVYNKGTFDPETAKISDEFNESEHPRGQPDNPGQFTKGAGASKTKVTREHPKGIPGSQVTASTMVNAETMGEVQGRVLEGNKGILPELKKILQGRVKEEGDEHGVHTFKDWMSPGKMGARIYSDLVTKQGMTHKEAKAKIQSLLKGYEQRYQRVLTAYTHPLQPTRRDSDGKLTMADGGPLPDHIAKLRIAPAWKNVMVSPDPDAALLAKGRDKKGRWQSLYSKSFKGSNEDVKYARVAELEKRFRDVQAKNEENRRSDNPRLATHADCLLLIMATGVRPGSDSDTKAKKKAYGATTLKGKHVVVGSNGRVWLRFMGKSGVRQSIPVDDPKIASMMKARAEAAGPDGRVLPGITPSSLLAYTNVLTGPGFKTYDFRTLFGTTTAQAEVAKMKPPKSKKEYKKKVMEVAKRVAAKLGNTPSMALKSYISPVVFAGWNDFSPGTTDAEPDPDESLLPQAYFGPMDEPPIDWMEYPDPGDPEDDESEGFPDDLVAMLGFDPMEYDEDEE
jgi:DNA topoisomerase IB